MGIIRCYRIDWIELPSEKVHQETCDIGFIKNLLSGKEPPKFPDFTIFVEVPTKIKNDYPIIDVIGDYDWWIYQEAVHEMVDRYGFIETNKVGMFEIFQN